MQFVCLFICLFTGVFVSPPPPLRAYRERTKEVQEHQSVSEEELRQRRLEAARSEAEGRQHREERQRARMEQRRQEEEVCGV